MPSAAVQTSPDAPPTLSVIDAVCLRVEAYYTAKLARHGATPRGVDWSCSATQWLRFVQLLKICAFETPFSLNDLGCGYGALAAFLAERHPETNIDYLGIDLSAAMVQRARRRHRGKPATRFVVGRNCPRQADYSVASGIMNVMLGVPVAVWENFVRTTLLDLHRMSIHGFAVNFLAKPPPATRADQLYCPDPAKWSRFCREELNCSVEILSDYGMGEFTLLARRAVGAQPQVAVTQRTRRPTTLDARIRRAALLAISPDGHTDDDRLQSAFKLLRAKAPVYWVDCPGVRPFWLVTRHAGVTAVERRGAPFIAAPRSVLSSQAGAADIHRVSGKAEVLRSLFQMDNPEHRAYRDIALPWFTRAGLAGLVSRVTDCADQAVMRIADRREVFDFMAEVAVPFPLRVMTHILGLPAGDDPLILKFARGLTGAEDPDRMLADRPAESVRLAGIGLRDYFDRVTADRLSRPSNDLSSAIANARIDGMPIPDYERLSYFMQLAIAGQENTAYCISGGMHALLTHPAQLARLQSDPGLIDMAIEEILRWTSPGRHLMRTATADVEIDGQLIRAGEAVAVFFNSANRDETVFDAADTFRIERSPNPHLAFGLGSHFCLGVHLARLELRALFQALLPRLVRAECAAPPHRARSAVISGIAFLPLRCVWK
jgi:cytochrome P450